MSLSCVRLLALHHSFIGSHDGWSGRNGRKDSKNHYGYMIEIAGLLTLSQQLSDFVSCQRHSGTDHRSLGEKTTERECLQIRPLSCSKPVTPQSIVSLIPELTPPV